MSKGLPALSRLIVYSVPVIILAAVAWLTLRPKGPRPVELGETVPAFSLPLVAGTRAAPGTNSTGSRSNDFVKESSVARLGDYRGQVVVLNFWATWCPPCVVETPSLEDFAEKVRPWGVVVIGASECKDCTSANEEDSAALAAFIAKFHITYPIARDPARALATRYGTIQFPETYIIDRNGRLAEKIISNTDWDDPRMLAFVRSLAQPNQQQASN